MVDHVESQLPPELICKSGGIGTSRARASSLAASKPGHRGRSPRLQSSPVLPGSCRATAAVAPEDVTPTSAPPSWHDESAMYDTNVEDDNWDAPRAEADLRAGYPEPDAERNTARTKRMSTSAGGNPTSGAHEDKQEVLRKYGLQPDRIELGEVLGEGAFGLVRSGVLKGSRTSTKEVAVKLLPIDGADYNMILSEVVALARASESCKFACKLLGVCRKDEFFCIIMKKYEKGPLSEKLNTYAERRAPRREVERWILEICQGVVELHEENIVLHDLKPSNVLLDDFGGVVVADFGLARIIRNTRGQTQATATGSMRGTVPYMSPEALSPDFGRPSKPSDIWALGCTIYELLTGKAPWAGSYTTVQILHKVTVARECPSFTGLEDRIDRFADVLRMCFCFAASARPTADKVLEEVKSVLQASNID
eukprot:TRINITY_DN3312_c0_g2_i2.p1 TRINITY_DN3312_c0_g2~~TRINITY_DN3312_c0_g2_i2.p1  ORF type:complete len:424 (+),score=63.15 TRINITY_DN3312_c0_g2_i2:352-1623(+)